MPKETEREKELETKIAVDAEQKKKDDKWVKMVALTTTVLAVLTAISTMKSGGNTTAIQLLTTEESNKWSYFQAKSIKQHVTESQKCILEINSLSGGAVGKVSKEKLTACIADIARYDTEKKQIQTEAEKITSDIIKLKKRGGNFGNSLLFFQIAILLSSVSVLFRIKYLWKIGIGSAVIALVYLINAFYMFF
jgi:hypothetical protein